MLGAGFGAVFVNLLVGFRYIGIGIGLIMLILLCVHCGCSSPCRWRASCSCPSACRRANEAFEYGVNRLLDTSIGLATALVVNLVIKPYNNRGGSSIC